MGFLRKFKWGAALLGSLLFVAMHTSFAFAAEKLPPEKAYLYDVYKNMAKISSVHYDVSIKADTPLGTVETVVNGDAQDKPLSMKNDAGITYRDMLNNENTMLVKQYVEQYQGNLMMYMFVNQTWVKQMLPVDPVMKASLAADEKFNSQAEMLKFIKSVKLIRETPTFKYMEVTLDMIEVSDAVGATVKQDKMQNKDMQRAAAVGRLALLAAGDIKYIVKVDKATKMIKEFEFDLTEPIRKGAGLFLDIAEPKDRAAIEDFLAKSTLHMQATYSQFNQISPIEIPQEARDNATDISPMSKI
ncbi:hypothetical protein [Anaerospora sp.]|uniref:hypothetical protein n=1 Tax=Anaerospora sp. TaxID=1960278 RepID=UPI0028965B0C|nr:hypothetical protein [Anaerospora sp.]